VVEFLDILNSFVNDLDVAMVNLRDSVQLTPLTVNLDKYKSPADYANATHDPEVVNSLESKRRHFDFQLCI
jgi:dynein heavy chain